MQNAQSLAVRFLRLSAAVVVCLPLLGCGSDDAPRGHHRELEFRQQRQEPEAHTTLLELLPPGADNVRQRTVDAAELGTILGGSDTGATITAQ